MNILIKQLEKSLELDVPVLSLMGAVTLIDICAAVDSPNGKTNRQKFINWYEKYIGVYFFMFNGHECYALRCKLLHQGKADYSHDQMNSFFKNGKILFNVGRGTIQNCNANGYYYLDPKEFIRIIINGVKKWEEKTKHLDYVQQNKKLLIKIIDYDPGGLVGSGEFLF